MPQIPEFSRPTAGIDALLRRPQPEHSRPIVRRLPQDNGGRRTIVTRMEGL